MSRSGRMSVALPRQQLAQVRQIVEAGEFDSAGAVVREALRVWLQRRALHAGLHGASHLKRSVQARFEPPAGEISERVDLLFDATDAKA
jgi:Arc/MetJ-type ribon-helix-helix transcriptional regulator